ncbi:hypothetical protein NQ315_000007 [Exocentrus adspersus]|uniref:Uncharacterized protein n=1 Tax=Exocentrus adspersus TaxID=1586481 RepID=A0AAV8VG06_9CUCU|nr:hypothetical protein NQ315_000007 [Exocentrus adspersus]
MNAAHKYHILMVSKLKSLTLTQIHQIQKLVEFVETSGNVKVKEKEIKHLPCHSGIVDPTRQIRIKHIMQANQDILSLVHIHLEATQPRLHPVVTLAQLQLGIQADLGISHRLMQRMIHTLAQVNIHHSLVIPKLSCQ